MQILPMIQRNIFIIMIIYYFSKDNVAIMSIEGRTFPVDIYFYLFIYFLLKSLTILNIHYIMKPISDYIQSTVNTIMDIHKFQPSGDILAFLTGQEEIDSVVSLIKEKAR